MHAVVLLTCPREMFPQLTPTCKVNAVNERAMIGTPKTNNARRNDIVFGSAGLLFSLWLVSSICNATRPRKKGESEKTGTMTTFHEEDLRRKVHLRV